MTLRDGVDRKRRFRGRSWRPLHKLQRMLEDLFAFFAKGATVAHFYREDLTPAEVEELWRCYSEYVDRPRDSFERALSHATDVNVYRHASGEFLGFEAYRVLQVRPRGRTYVVVYTVFADLVSRVRGRNFLQMAVLGRLLLLLTYYPFRRHYFLGTSATYLSYLVLARNMAEFWPRSGAETPVFAREILNAVMSELEPEGWDPDRGILRGEGKLRYRVGLADEASASDPDVAFFAERNPGQADGDALACLVPITVENVVALSKATLRRWIRYCWRRVRS
jgi:hypothetical protein